MSGFLKNKIKTNWKALELNVDKLCFISQRVKNWMLIPLIAITFNAWSNVAF